MSKVIVVTHTNRVSGAERVLATMLRASRVPAVILLGDAAVAGWFRRQGLEVEVIKGLKPISDGGGRVRGCLRLMGATVRLWVRLQSIPASYIHVMTPVSLILAWFLQLCGLRTPIVLHCHDYYKYRPAPVRWLVTIASLAVTRVVAVSHDIKMSLQALAFPSSLISVIYNGVDMDNLGEEGGPIDRVVMCSYFEEWKGLHVGVEGFVRARREVGNHAFLTVIGDIPDVGYRRAIEQRLPPEDRACVEFVGALPNAAQRFAEAGVFLHVPVQSDPFPTVVLEAMAAGSLVIVSPLGGAREAVADKGIVLPRPSVDCVREALRRLWSSGTDFRDLRDGARLRAQKEFSAKAVGVRYNDWLGGIIGWKVI